jgi:hypothetical protein
MASVLLEALIANRAPGQWVSYSRRKEWWSNSTRYRSTTYSYYTVVPVIDQLSSQGFLDRIIHNAHRLKLTGDSLRKQ